MKDKIVINLKPGLLKKLALVAATAGLFGAAESGPYRQGQWAQLLADLMGLTRGLPASAGEEAISLLGGRGSNVRLDSHAAHLLITDSSRRTWRYDLVTPATASWLLTARLTVPGFISVDRGQSRLAAVGLAGAAADVGRFPLLAGNHSIEVSVSRGGAPELALVGGCGEVAPEGGWSKDAALTWGVLGRTVVQATRQEAQLPAAEALSIRQVTSGESAVDVAGEGIYTVLLSGHAFDHAGYRMDSCGEVIPPAREGADGWRQGETVALAAGTHRVTFDAYDSEKGDGRIRLVRRSSNDADYLTVLANLGVKLPGVTAALEEDRHPDGGPRHARGDASSVLGSRAVTAAEAEAVLDTPGVARLMPGYFRPAAIPVAHHRKGPEPAGYDSFEVPISPTVPNQPEAQ